MQFVKRTFEITGYELPCIGIDNKLHIYDSNEDTCKCGIKIKSKKITENDKFRYSCWECTY